MASHLALSSRPSSAFTAAAAFLTSANAYTTASGMRSPEMRKKRRERSVCAPHSRSAGTSIGPKLSFSMRLPLMAAVMLLLQQFRGLCLFRVVVLVPDFLVHLGHVERLGLRDHLIERSPGQCARLLEQDDLVAEHHQGGNRANPEGAGQLLLLVGVHLGEHHVRIRLGRLLVHRSEAFAGTAPWRPEVDDHHRVFVDGLLEILLGEIQRRHRGPLGKKRAVYSRHPCMQAGSRHLPLGRCTSARWSPRSPAGSMRARRADAGRCASRIWTRRASSPAPPARSCVRSKASVLSGTDPWPIKAGAACSTATRSKDLPARPMPAAAAEKRSPIPPSV